MNWFGWITDGTETAILKGFENAAKRLGLQHAPGNDAAPLAALEARMLPALAAPEPTPPSTPARRQRS